MSVGPQIQNTGTRGFKRINLKNCFFQIASLKQEKKSCENVHTCIHFASKLSADIHPLIFLLERVMFVRIGGSFFNNLFGVNFSYIV